MPLCNTLRQGASLFTADGETGYALKLFKLEKKTSLPWPSHNSFSQVSMQPSSSNKMPSLLRGTSFPWRAAHGSTKPNLLRCQGCIYTGLSISYAGWLCFFFFISFQEQEPSLLLRWVLGSTFSNLLTHLYQSQGLTVLPLPCIFPPILPFKVKWKSHLLIWAILTHHICSDNKDQ